MIKAILFDVDGVLLDSLSANLKFFQDLMTVAGYPIPSAELYATLFHLPGIEVIKRLIQAEESKVREIWELGKNGTVRYPNELIKMPADTLPSLTELVQDYQLGIVTSRVKGGVFSIPQLAQLQPLLKVMIAFEDTVKHKPDPEPLLLAAKRLQLSSAECVYVGDAMTDFQAARAAGMKSIMYGSSSVTDADGYVKTLSELKSVLSKLRS